MAAKLGGLVYVFYIYAMLKATRGIISAFIVFTLELNLRIKPRKRLTGKKQEYSNKMSTHFNISKCIIYLLILS